MKTFLFELTLVGAGGIAALVGLWVFVVTSKRTWP